MARAIAEGPPWLRDGAVSMQDSQALLDALARGDSAALTRLFEGGVDPGATDKEYGCPIILNAADTGEIELVRPFLDHGLWCIDLAPAEQGTRGQVFAWEIHAGPCNLRASSFEQFLRNYRDELLSGRYTYDSDSGTFDD